LAAYRAKLFDHQERYQRILAGIGIPAGIAVALVVLWLVALKIKAFTGEAPAPETGTTSQSSVAIPNMTAQVRSAILGELANPSPVAQVTFHIDLRNAGPPTTTNSWRLSVKLRDGKSYKGILVTNASGFYAEGHHEQPVKIVNVEDYIWKKTEQEPLKLGGALDGYITFLFPGLLRDQVGDLDSVLTLSWKDSRDSSYDFDYKIPAQKSILNFETRPNSHDTPTPLPKKTKKGTTHPQQASHGSRQQKVSIASLENDAVKFGGKQPVQIFQQ
jgi:hypothetical protein